MYTVCIICTDVMKPETELYAIRCGHIFHQACLMRWILTSQTCPQCRNPATLNCMFRLYPAAASDAETLVAAQRKKLNEQEEKLKVYEAALKRKEKMLKAKEACMQRTAVTEETSNQEVNRRETSANEQPSTSTSRTNLNDNGNSSRAERPLTSTESGLRPKEYLKMPESLKDALERVLKAAQQQDLQRRSNISLN